MLYRNASIFVFACTLGVTGCRDNGNVSPVDLSMGGGGTGGGDMAGGAGADMTAKNYQMSTIATMRSTGNPGDFQLTDVVAIALTPSTKSPKLYVQDAAGKAFSAMETRCSSSPMAKHPCSVASTVTTVGIGHKVTIQGSYIKTASTGFEEFYIDTITDNGAAAMVPAPLTGDEKAISHVVGKPPSMTEAGDFFQLITVTPTEDVVMYDWTPTELKASSPWPGCTTIPYVFGFGMIPMSAGGTATAGCTVKTAPAPTNAVANPKEIFIGTDFYKTFTVSSDCQCAKAPTQVPAAATKWPMGMAMTGTLTYDVPFMGTVGYKFFSPIPSPAGGGPLTALAAPPM